MKICSSENMALILGISKSRVHALTRDGIFQQVEKSKYSIPDTVQNYINYKIKPYVEKEESGIDEEKRLLTRAQREKAEIEVAQIKGEVHNSEDVEAVMNDLVAAFRAKILSLPSKIAPRLQGKTAIQIKAQLEEEIAEVLTELSEYDPQYFYQRNKKYVKMSEIDEGGE